MLPFPGMSLLTILCSLDNRKKISSGICYPALVLLLAHVKDIPAGAYFFKTDQRFSIFQV